MKDFLLDILLDHMGKLAIVMITLLLTLSVYIWGATWFDCQLDSYNLEKPTVYKMFTKKCMVEMPDGSLVPSSRMFGTVGGEEGTEVIE